MTTTFREQMQNDDIPKIPLIQAGQTIRDLADGIYPVTGGEVYIGYLPRDNITRITGFTVNGMPVNPVHIVGNQPLNIHFASVTYEMREKGQKNLS